MTRLTRENAKNYIGSVIEFVAYKEKHTVRLDDVILTEKTCSLKVDFPLLKNRLVIWHHKIPHSRRKVYVVSIN